jgi:uncharacterized membrane protein
MPYDYPEKTFKIVIQKKEQYTLHELAKQAGFSTEFLGVAKQVDGMKYEDYTNYDKIKSLFRKMIVNE